MAGYMEMHGRPFVSHYFLRGLCISIQPNSVDDRILTNFFTKILPIVDIDEADAPGLKLENITPADKILIVHGTVPDRNQKKRKGESFDLIRIKGQINKLFY